MPITYDRYPLLRKIEISRKHLSKDQPLAGFSKKGATFVQKNKNLRFLLETLTYKTAEVGYPFATHFYLDDKTEDTFRLEAIISKYLNFSTIQESVGGIILLDNSIQLLYLVLSQEVTKQLLKRDHRYIAAALFKAEGLAAFEDGVLAEDELLLNTRGRLDEVNIFDQGGYLGFAIAVLCRSKEMKRMNRVKAPLNKTKHEIRIITAPK